MDCSFPVATQATGYTMVLGCGNKVWFAMLGQDSGVEYNISAHNQKKNRAE
jgi:hypothetical protein